MLRVPVYKRQVEAGRLPQSRVNVRVSPQDISGGIEKGLDDAASAGAKKNLSDRSEQREARLMNAYSRLGNARLDIESTVKQHYQGDAALKNDLAAQTAEMLKRQADAIAKELPDEDLKLGFKKIYLREADGLRGSMVSHVVEQGDKVADDSYKSALRTAASKAAQAFGQGRDALEAREEALAAVSTRAVTKGWTPDVSETERRDALTLIHKGVVERLQSADRAAEADAYLTLHEKEMDGTVLGDLRKTIAPAALASRAEAAVRAIEAAHPGDPVARATAVKALEGEIGAKARQVFREREQMDEEAANDAQKEHLGTMFDALEKGTVKTETQLEKHPSFGKLTDEGKARARAYRRTLSQAERSVRAAERTAIAAVDDSMRKDFEARGLQERAGLDVRTEYAGRVSVDGMNILRKLQQGAKRDWDKDRGVSETEFRRMVTEESAGLPWIESKEDLDELLVYVGRERGRWLDDPKNVGKEPPREEVAKWLVGALTNVDLPMSEDKPRFRTTAAGRGNATEQPYLERRAKTSAAAPPAAAGAPAAASPSAGIPPLLARPADDAGAAPVARPRVTSADIPKAERDAIERTLRSRGKAVSDAEVLKRYQLAHPEVQ
jgi:hypothetical protein